MKLDSEPHTYVESVFQRKQASSAKRLQVLGTLTGLRNIRDEIRGATRGQIIQSFIGHSMTVDFFSKSSGKLVEGSRQERGMTLFTF